MTSNIYCTSTNSLTIWTFCFQTFLWPQQRWGSREALAALKPSRRERCLHTTGNLYITLKTFPSIVSWWHITYFQGNCSPHLWVSFLLLRGMVDREKFQLRAVKILSKFQDFQHNILVHCAKDFAPQAPVSKSKEDACESTMGLIPSPCNCVLYLLREPVHRILIQLKHHI